MNTTNLPFRPRASGPRAPGPPTHRRPMGISKDVRKSREKERKDNEKEKVERIRAAARAELIAEQEKKEMEKKARQNPKVFSQAQVLRMEELLVQKDSYAAKFRAARKEIEAKKAALSDAMDAVEEAEKTKKVLEMEYADIIKELKPLSG
ncbi:hypothetical protein V498_02503 [Pseudogymnoascus sp. VKM F-4517 (FW-2822)]|nr:hypothetical protein V498_02503 [Pseudogymnoascus sp. VKM F-4517 (FW-2822)]